MANNQNTKKGGEKSPRYTVYLILVGIRNGKAYIRVVVLDPKGFHEPNVPILLYVNGDLFPGDFMTGDVGTPTEGVLETTIPVPANAEKITILAVAGLEGKPNTGAQTFSVKDHSAARVPNQNDVELIIREGKLGTGSFYLYMALANCTTGRGIAETMIGIPTKEVIVDGVRHTAEFTVNVPERGRVIHVLTEKPGRAEIDWSPERWVKIHKQSTIYGPQQQAIQAKPGSSRLVKLLDGCK